MRRKCWRDGLRTTVLSTNVVESSTTGRVCIELSTLYKDRGLSTLHPGLDQCHQVRGTSAAGALDPGSVIDGVGGSSPAAELALTDVTPHLHWELRMDARNCWSSASVFSGSSLCPERDEKGFLQP